jgi:hypothetical protein
MLARMGAARAVAGDTYGPSMWMPAIAASATRRGRVRSRQTDRMAT